MHSLTVDEKQRIRLPDAKPGQVFAYEKGVAGQVILTPVDPDAVPRAKLVRRNGRLLGEASRPVTTEDVKRAMENFPYPLAGCLGHRPAALAQSCTP